MHHWRIKYLAAACMLALGCGSGSMGGMTGDPQPSVDGGAPVAMPETCNGFDDDLDGDVDEGCSCQAGQTQKCFPRPPGPIQGICKQGTQSCIATDEFGSWGPCQGAVTPQQEICGDTIDQDCSGADLPCMDSGVTALLDVGVTGQSCESFTFGKSARPVDIVWVIDQSGSMKGEIAMVRNNMNQFASTISQATVDYRVVLVASRYVDKDNNQICIPAPLAGANCSNGQFFQQVEQHVDSHDALTQYVAHVGTIESFMRPNSVRHVVVVTDDECKGVFCGAAFHAWIKTRPGYQDYVFHSIVGLVDKGCVADDGKSYMLLSTLTGGVQFHICNSDWSPVFQQLSKSVITATTKFKLTKKAKAGTIKVTYGNTPAVQGKDWDYDAVINQIVLKGTLPQNGAAIHVCYELG